MIASDGVWEFLKNRKLTEVVEKYYKRRDIEGACDKILKISLNTWIKEDESSIDDITLILIFLN